MFNVTKLDGGRGYRVELPGGRILCSNLGEVAQLMKSVFADADRWDGEELR